VKVPQCLVYSTLSVLLTVSDLASSNCFGGWTERQVAYNKLPPLTAIKHGNQATQTTIIHDQAVSSALCKEPL
jgi:hypothetical protein